MKAGILAAALALAPLPAAGCALELVLAVDVSGSIDDEEFALQIGGLSDAFRTPALIRAVERLEGGVLVTLTQWSGGSRQAQLTGWHRLEDGAAMAGFAEAVIGAGRHWRNFATAIGEALEHAATVSGSAPATCRRRVIDVSGDGVSNEGRSPGPIAARLAGAGYTVNALVIRGARPDPVPHYEREVIAGPGAFVEIAESFEDYPRAILKKLLREIDQPLFISEAAN